MPRWPSRGVGPALTDAAAADQVEIQIKYAGYIERQHDEVEKQLRNENTCCRWI